MGYILFRLHVLFYLQIRINPPWFFEKEAPDAMRRWDNWDYRIFGPRSLDDISEIVVELINKDNSMIRLGIQTWKVEEKVN